MLYMDVGGQEDDKRYIPSNEHLKECIEGKLQNYQYHFFQMESIVNMIGHKEYHFFRNVLWRIIVCID